MIKNIKMKKNVLTIIALLLGLVTFAQTNSIIGNWYGQDEKNDSGRFEFKKDTAIMYFRGKPGPMNYKLDSTKTPNWIDFTTTVGDRALTLYGLVKFIDKDTIKLEMFPGENKKHPTRFTDAGNELTSTAIILKRRK